MLRTLCSGATFGIPRHRGSWKIGDLSDPALAWAQLRSPSVFNFFRPGCKPSVPPGVGPEFQLVSETGVGATSQLHTGRDPQQHLRERPRSAQQRPAPPTTATTSRPATNRLAIVFRRRCAGGPHQPAGIIAGPAVCRHRQSSLPDALQATTPVTNASTDAARLDRVAAAVFLVMASAECLVQSKPCHCTCFNPNSHTRRAFLRRSTQPGPRARPALLALNLAAMGEAAAINATDLQGAGLRVHVRRQRLRCQHRGHLRR